jgi:hypothetical protein
MPVRGAALSRLHEDAPVHFALMIPAFLRYVDCRLSLPCCMGRPLPVPAECRPKFISVTVSGARFWERSTLFNRFNLCENCYISVTARDARCALRVCETPVSGKA